MPTSPPDEGGPLAEAFDTLARAVEAVQAVHDDLGEPRNVYLAVVWGFEVEDQSVMGWNTTDHAGFALKALLKEAAVEVDREPQDD